MKKWSLLFGTILILGSYVYFGIYLPDRKKETKKQAMNILPDDENLREIHISTPEKDVFLEKKDDVWWVIKPHEYLADQEFVVKAVQIMTEAPVVNQFLLEDDRFGFKEPEAFFHMTYDSGLNKRILVGKAKGAAQHIYLLDKDSNQVHVVHNVWAQLLYFPIDRFFAQTLPIVGTQVKTIQFGVGGNRVWKLTSGSERIMSIEYLGKLYESEKSQWLWFFKNIRDFELKDLKFGQSLNFKVHSELEVETEKGNIRFQFNRKADKIFVPQLNVFADVDPYSLKSLSDELDKVINRDKK